MAKILIGNIKTPLANNLTTTDVGVAALDAAQGKVLDDKIAKNADDVAQLNSNKLAYYQQNSDISAAFYTRASGQGQLDVGHANEKRFQLIFDFEKHKFSISFFDGNTWTPKDIATW